MKRIVVIGGTGFFGGLIVERLRAAGLKPLIASRRGGDLRLDVENPADLRAHLQVRDLVIDATGPFAGRSMALVDAALRTGFDIIDLSESSQYAKQVLEREPPIRAAGIRVLTSCSTLSTLSAAVIRQSRIPEPKRVLVRLVPASRVTASATAVTAFLSSLRGRGRGGGLRCDSADEVTLPLIWPSLKEVEFVVDSGVPGLNALIGRAPKFAARMMPRGIRLMRLIGPRRGRVSYEIQSKSGSKRWTFIGERSYLTAVIPAVLAARLLAVGRFPHPGLVAPDRHVDPAELFRALEAEGIEIKGN